MFRSLRLLTLVLASALLLSGCQLPTGSPPRNPAVAAAEAKLFALPPVGRKSSIGQLRYVTPARAVIGDTVVNRAPGHRFQVDFTAGPGVPLMRLQRAGDEVLAEGLFAWGRWRGKAGRAGRLSQWVALSDVFAAADQPEARKQRRLQSPPGDTKMPWEATIERHGNGTLHRVTVEFPRKKERFLFVFAP